MSLLTLRNLGVTQISPLFQELDLTLSRGDRLGLVAANGCGKSTLLRLIAGQLSPTTGDITTARGLRVGLVAQDMPADLLPMSLFQMVLSALPPDQAEYEAWRVHIVLEDLQVPPALWDRPLAALSGGWQRVALLARCWITEPDLLLLDEPTNHLDLARIGALQAWLAGVAGSAALIVASHDRAFLDAVTNRTLFLRSQASRGFALPYSAARRALADLDAADRRQADNDLAKVQQLRQQAARLKNTGINSGSDLLLTKTRQLTARADRLEQAVQVVHQPQLAGQIRLDHSDSAAHALVSIAPTEVTTPDGRVLFRTGQLWINRGDRVALLGGNGIGKSRFIGLVCDAVAGQVPTLRVAPAAQVGIVDQGLSPLQGKASAFDIVAEHAPVGDQRARSLLAGAGIAIALQDRPVAVLSGGMRARLAMLLLRLTAPNLYLLDEPTNHLDIDGQEALERELQKDQATALLVSHDRAFLRTVATRFWQIKGPQLVEVAGPESFFAEQMKTDADAGP